MDNLCICCGESVPEGRQVCRECESKAESRPKRNIDRLREMSTEGLARFILDVADCCEAEGDESCKRCPLYASDDCSHEGITAWLEKEVEGNGA